MFRFLCVCIFRWKEEWFYQNACYHFDVDRIVYLLCNLTTFLVFFVLRFVRFWQASVYYSNAIL